MKFITESYSFAATDGRIVLRARIDKPLYFDHAAYEYFYSLHTFLQALFKTVYILHYNKAIEFNVKVFILWLIK